MSNKKFYIAGMGMITPLGADVNTTSSAVNAGLSAYQISPYQNKENHPVTMGMVPAGIFQNENWELDEGESAYNAQYDHMIKMGILAIDEALAGNAVQGKIPLVLAMPEPELSPSVHQSLIFRNFVNHFPEHLATSLSRVCPTGRSAGIACINFAFNYLFEKFDYLLVGGSDSYRDIRRLTLLDQDERLLHEGAADAFAPSQGACFLLLTPYKEYAFQHQGQVIAVHEPGLSDEPGHRYSDFPYKGEALDKAFKQALVNVNTAKIHRIYSTMNGEHYWAKEYGVAYLRNRDAFVDDVVMEHPADCYGDLGAASTTALIALAASNLFTHKTETSALVYGSSDTAARGAVVVEKIAC